jgi:hypothetical protein
MRPGASFGVRGEGRGVAKGRGLFGAEWEREIKQKSAEKNLGTVISVLTLGTKK